MLFEIYLTSLHLTLASEDNIFLKDEIKKNIKMEKEFEVNVLFYCYIILFVKKHLKYTHETTCK